MKLMKFKNVFLIFLLLISSGEIAVAAEVFQKTASSMEINASSTTNGTWKAAFDATHKKTSIEKKADGITTFMATFTPPEKGDQKILSFAEYDAFRKLNLIIPVATRLHSNLFTNVTNYVSIPDGKAPVLFMSPYFLGKDGAWLNMYKVSVLLDDSLIFEREFKSEKTSRASYVYNVEESADFVLKPSEIENLRKIKKQSQIAIRITGSKRYVSLKPKTKGIDVLEDFKESLIESIAIYDIISKETSKYVAN